ncbi:phage tail terminator family protein [Cohnella caldifontis]|uniref:phage tail terminator family protein n=1 Tax=Cohnella caldifontis TaxID=3027471 RepID=UPI0023EBCAD8|nr:hypothetical protein [Cohnella sp. YIM B05605]
MGDITLNGVQDLVVAALHAQFPDVDVYVEIPEGGLTGPCFFVKLLSASQTQELNRRYRRVHSFDVQFVAADGSNRAMQETAERLYGVLETIGTDGEGGKGIGMRHEIADRVLHFYVDYRFLVYRPAPDDPAMGTLKREGAIKS